MLDLVAENSDNQRVHHRPYCLAHGGLYLQRQGQAAKVALPSHGTYPQLYAPINPLNSLSDQEKVK
jgi:hypothetical protein